ncbi:MAG: amino acid adenylation domain-containing protein [Nannocystaceae bacterium]
MIRCFSCYVIGSDALLVQCAELLLAKGHDLRGVIASTPQPARFADKHGLPLIDATGNYTAALRLRPYDYLFSISHLSILSDEVLSTPSQGTINFHDGPLPRYAGRNAPAWALMAGEACHGITWHEVTRGIDEGDILAQRWFSIADRETSVSLNTRNFEAGIESFGELVDHLGDGSVVPVPQDTSQRSYFGRHHRPPAACAVDWFCTTAHIDAMVRALDFGRHPNPIGLARVAIDRQFAAITQAEPSDSHSAAAPGTIVAITSSGVEVTTSDGVLRIQQMTTLHGEPLAAEAAADRLGLREGARFTTLDEDEKRRWSALGDRCATSESFWVRRLRLYEAMDLPFTPPSAHTGEPDWRDIGVELPPGFVEHHRPRLDAAVIALLAIYLCRIGGPNPVQIAYSDARLHAHAHADEAAPWLSQRVPLSLPINDAHTFDTFTRHVGAEVDRICSRGTWQRDVVARYPELRARADLADGGLGAISLHVGGQASPPLATDVLQLHVDADTGASHLRYDANALIPRRATDIAAALVQLAATSLGPPPPAIAEMSAIPDAVRQRLLENWNATSRPRPRQSCIHELLAARVAQHPHANALSYRDQTLTYWQIDAKANQLTRRLAQAGVVRNQLVGIHVGRSLDLVVAVLAVLKAGAAYLPLDPEYPSSRLEFMMIDSGACTVVTSDTARLGHIAGPARVIELDGERPGLSGLSEEPMASRTRPGDLAYLIYTSGSSGEPKGVMIEHRNALNFFVGMDEVIPHDPPGTWLAVTSLSFDISVLELLWTLTRGFHVVIHSLAEGVSTAPHATSQNDDSIAALTQRHRVTHFQCTPSMLRLLLDQPDSRSALARMRHIFVGGEAFPSDLVRELDELLDGSLTNMYGPTETTVWSTTQPVVGRPTSVPIGRPIANTRLYVLDEKHRLVPIGVPGELYIAGEGVARGYHRREGLTRERFLADAFTSGTHRIYRTGDLARWQDDGCLAFCGRNDRQVKLRGHRIELGELEARISAEAAVRQAVLTLREDRPGDQRLIAYLVADGAELDTGEVERDLRRQIPAYMMPNTFVVLDELPLTPNGKVDRNALPAPEQVGAISRPQFVAPTQGVETTLAEIWRTTLGVHEVGIDDNFFDLGGHSLSIVRLHRALTAELSPSVALVDLYRFPTIRSLARRLSNDGASNTLGESRVRANRRRDHLAQRQRSGGGRRR